jgi:hypothetical protein
MKAVTRVVNMLKDSGTTCQMSEELDVFIRQLLNKCVKFLKEHGYLFSGMKKRILVSRLMARVKAGGKASENFPVTSPS